MTSGVPDTIDDEHALRPDHVHAERPDITAHLLKHPRAGVAYCSICACVAYRNIVQGRVVWDWEGRMLEA